MTETSTMTKHHLWFRIYTFFLGQTNDLCLYVPRGPWEPTCDGGRLRITCGHLTNKM